MKTLLFKLLSLVVVVAGAGVIVVAADPSDWVMRSVELLNRITDTGAVAGVPVAAWVGAIGGVLVLLGLLGLLPERRGGPAITFRTDRGNVSIELRPIQQTLAKVIGALPEVRRIKVRVAPDRTARKINIHAAVVLQNCADAGLRRTSAVVSDCIAHTVSTAFGLEDMVEVKLNVVGVHVDANSTAQKIRDEVESDKGSLTNRMAVALARPPLSALTLDDTVVVERPAPAPAEKKGLEMEVLDSSDPAGLEEASGLAPGDRG